MSCMSCSWTHQDRAQLLEECRHSDLGAINVPCVMSDVELFPASLHPQNNCEDVIDQSKKIVPERIVLLLNFL